jgi:hypothetical protein
MWPRQSRARLDGTAYRRRGRSRKHGGKSFLRGRRVCPAVAVIIEVSVVATDGNTRHLLATAITCFASFDMDAAAAATALGRIQLWVIGS